MKKAILSIWYLLFLLMFQNVFADGTCGTNVKYTVSGNTISFSKAKTGADAVWNTDCGAVFKEDPLITIVKVNDRIRVLQGTGLFKSFRYVKEMYLSNLDVSGVTDMTEMFRMDSKLDENGLTVTFTALEKLDVSSWDTSRVTSMEAMFLHCSALTTLDVSKWDTSGVTNMWSLFDSCSALTALDVSNWNTANVTNMSAIFSECTGLTALDVTRWDTSAVTNMGGMFFNCSGLTALDVSRWDTSGVENMGYMFYNCSTLKELDVSGWNTSNVTVMEFMFLYCYALEKLDVGSWNTSGVVTMTNMFLDCESLTGLNVRNWNVSNVESMYGMFCGCKSLTGLDVSKWDTSNVEIMWQMFWGCTSLSSLDVSGWDTSNVTIMGQMFDSCSSLTGLDVSGWDTSNVTNMVSMFRSCSSLTALDLSGWDTSNVTDMGCMFYWCSSLTALDVSGWDTSNVTDMSLMFTNSNALTALDMSSWNTSNVTDMSKMFASCSALHTLTLGKNTLKKNIFESLPEYNGTWFYRVQGKDASKPLALNTAKSNGSLFTSYNYSTMAGTWSVDQPEPVDLVIRDSNVRGKNKEIQVVIPWESGMTKVECALYDDGTGQPVSPLPKFRERMDANGKNRIISWVGDPLVNGRVYRLEIRVWNGVWSDTVRKYGMPIANVYGATVVAGNKTMIINTRHREPTDGTRYMIYDAETGKELAYKVGTRTNTTWTYSSLTNGKLYYVVAVPYRDYKGQRLWGPNENKIYFLPMGVPGSGKITFTNNTSAAVSIGRDANADGIRVLYRTAGGPLMNGCEGSGNSCTVRNLNRNAAYEFYAIKYRSINGRKYYSMGTQLPYNIGSSGLKAPQMNPTVTMSNSGSTTFTIKKAAEAEGISVLYREGEGDFKQACEKAGNVCNTMLDVKANYTFYIMQYKTVNGKKLYSSGIVARDFSSGKTGTGSASKAITAEEIPAEEIPAEEILSGRPEFYRLEDPVKDLSVPGFTNK